MPITVIRALVYDDCWHNKLELPLHEKCTAFLFTPVPDDDVSNVTDCVRKDGSSNLGTACGKRCGSSVFGKNTAVANAGTDSFFVIDFTTTCFFDENSFNRLETKILAK